MPEGNSARSVAAPTDSETIRTLLNRRSIRKYTDRPVAEETVEAVLRAAFRAPTSSNIQSYSVIVVREQDTKDKLSALTANQRHVAECGVFLAFCADLTRISWAMDKNGASIAGNNLELFLVSSVDAALVGMSAYLAAESVGLSGVMIGAVRNKPQQVAEVLGLPALSYCVFGMCLGWPAEAPEQKPRMAFDDVVHYERYDAAKTQKAVTDYDRELARHYESMGKPTQPDSWSHGVASRFRARPRDDLRPVLKARGIDCQ